MNYHEKLDLPFKLPLHFIGDSIADADDVCLDCSNKKHVQALVALVNRAAPQEAARKHEAAIIDTAIALWHGDGVDCGAVDFEELRGTQSTSAPVLYMALLDAIHDLLMAREVMNKKEGE